MGSSEPGRFRVFVERDWPSVLRRVTRGRSRLPDVASCSGGEGSWEAAAGGGGELEEGGTGPRQPLNRIVGTVLPGFRAEQTAWRADLMVRVQSLIILLLFVWVAEEYNYNQFFQSWTNGTLGVFGFLLGGTLAAVYAGILIVMYLGPPVTPANR